MIMLSLFGVIIRDDDDYPYPSFCVSNSNLLAIFFSADSVSTFMLMVR